MIQQVLQNNKANKRSKVNFTLLSYMKTSYRYSESRVRQALIYLFTESTWHVSRLGTNAVCIPLARHINSIVVFFVALEKFRAIEVY